MCATFVGKKWHLVDIVLEGKGIADVPKAGAEITLDEEKVHGYAGCNRFFGRYSIQEDEIMFESLASTKMFCIDTMAVEDAFFKALHLVNSIESAEDDLIMRSQDGTTQLRFHIKAAISK